MGKIILFILVISLPSAAFAECAFDFNGDSDCGQEYQSIYEDEPVQSGDCMCTETSDSTSNTQWVPNPSGDGGNYETVYTPGTTRQVPCPCY